MYKKEILSIFCRLNYISCEKFYILSELVDRGICHTHLHKWVEDKKLVLLLKEEACTWDLCEKILFQIIETQAKIAFPGSNDYPESFLDLDDPPVFLTYLGEPIWITKRGLSVVGSRRASDISLEWMEKSLGSFLESTDCMVVSGGAMGIDQKSHGVAIKHGRSTVALLPSGMGELYPKELEDWVEPIIKSGGALMSEYFPHVGVRRFHFHERNRMIAALGKGLLVVEGSLRSGTMISARYAIDLGRGVGVVPGHPGWSNFGGNLKLIEQGANLVRDRLDLKVWFGTSPCL